jgi:hypothetical protein
MKEKEPCTDKICDLQVIKKQKEGCRQENVLDGWKEREYCFEKDMGDLELQLDGVDSQMNALQISADILSKLILEECDNEQKEAWQDFQKSINAAAQKFLYFWEEWSLKK